MKRGLSAFKRAVETGVPASAQELLQARRKLEQLAIDRVAIEAAMRL